MAVVATKIRSQVAQRNEDMTARSMLLPVISFGIIQCTISLAIRMFRIFMCSSLCNIEQF